ncbi:wax ester/triacylglycerol synthase family O-acyltransferase [Cellulomonas soli]|uniref:wax ester/triacylglycerol synthase family O-acyltransferase n=1 Tax=Cellulomonas soli TaxID=931535 RepID=UPI003F846894
MAVDRLHALDAIFLPMESDVQALHVGSVLLLEGPAPAPGELLAHVRERLPAVLRHRRRVMPMPGDLGRPLWVDTDLDLGHHVRHVVLEPPGEDAQLRELVGAFMARRLDPARPLWELWQVDGLTGGRWAVVAKAHHAMIDGRTGADLLGTLLGDVDPARHPARPAGPPPAGPLPAVERRPAPTRAQLVGELAWWSVRLPPRAVRAVARAARHPVRTRRLVAQLRFGLAQVVQPDLPASVLLGPLCPARRWGWTGVDLAPVRDQAHRAGCTVNDVFLAALAGGYRRFLTERGADLDATVLRAIVPVSPPVTERTGTRANLASAVFVRLPVRLDDPTARLAAVAGQTAAQKAAGVPEATAAVVRAADHVPAPALLRAGRAYGRRGQGRVNVVASNVAGPAAPQQLAGRRVLELVPYVPLGQGVRVCAAMVSCGGRLTIGVTGDAEAVPDLDRLVLAVGEELRTLAAPASVGVADV